ncbi:NAD(P)H-quinone oxidoreductase [Massilia sp. erpn]|uniref:NAD(P)H-quinone oxidoreductase n=1 Tax=Massilia sp. erpn TaxID=2738142 RepID=UPI0021085C07|nr:NAD(P)H-quinone oxidoreductase [Massilia sp. erpn]
MQTTMNAIEFAGAGGPEVLRAVQRPVPHPGANEVLIRHLAAGINGPDVMQRKGLYDPPPGASDIPGLEVAGIVVAVGAQVSHIQPGDQVVALIPGGGYAEYSVADARTVTPLPEGLTPSEGAALLETFMTVWTNMFQRGQFRRGDNILIHGGASGIGTTATMLAKAFGAAKIITTVSTPEQREASLALGADVAVLYRDEDFVEASRQATDGRGVDIILDIIAGDYVARNYAAAAMNGRIVQIGVIAGPARELDLFPMLSKRLTHIGSTLRSRTADEKAALLDELRSNVWPLLKAGTLKPLVYRSFPLAEAGQAHALMDSGQHIGKIVLTMTDSAA